MNHSSLHITTNFHIIKKWVEKRGGKPGKLRSIEGEEINLLGILYSSLAQNEFDIIPWSQFFDEFASLNLAFMYQSDVVTDEQATFYKFVRREDYIDEIVEEENKEDVSLHKELEFLHM